MLFQGSLAVSLAVARVRGALHVLPAGTAVAVTRVRQSCLCKCSLFLCSLLLPEPPLLSEQAKASLRSRALDAASTITSETQERVPSNGTKMQLVRAADNNNSFQNFLKVPPKFCGLNN